MARQLPIMIVCPELRRYVRGEYAADDCGGYALGPGGQFLLERAVCSQDGGRCAATLCALHRYNRGGNGTWFPGRIVPAARKPPSRRRQPPADEGLGAY